MAKIRRVIRKIQPAYAPSFDDQLWPINVMLLVLGGFITGELVVLGNFGTGALWQNAWMLIAVVWTAIGGVMLAAWKMGGLFARRTQLSLATALLFVLLLLTIFAFVPVFSEIILEDDPRDVVTRREVTEPDYVQNENMQERQIQLDHERPVDTQEPEPETPEVEVPREEQPEQETQQQRPTEQPVPEVQREVEPTPVQREQQQTTPPRRSDTLSKLSRQTLPVQSQPASVASPSVAQNQPRPRTQIDAQTNSLQPRQSDASTQRPANPRETAETRSAQPELQTARRQLPNASQPQNSTARPTLERPLRQPNELPKVETVARDPAPTPREQPQPRRLEAQQTVERRNTETPVARPQTPTDQPAEQVTQNVQSTRAQPTPRQTPSVASTENTSRTVRQVRTAQTQAVAQPNVTQSQPVETPTQLTAQTRSVTRRQTSSNAPQQTAQATTQNATAPSQVQTARRQVASTNAPQTPSTQPSAARSVRQPSQTTRVAAAAERHSPTMNQQPRPSQFAPRGSVQRRTSASPQVRQQQAETQLADATSQTQVRQNRANPSPARTQLARNSTPSATRAVQEVRRPTTSQAVASQTAASQFQSQAATMQPQRASFARRSTDASAPTASQPSSSDVAANIPTQSSVASRARLTPVSSEPSVQPHNEPTQATRRTNNIAQAATSPVAAASPAAVQSSQPNPLAAQPRVAALSRSRRGMAGAGQQRNLDRGQPGPRTVSDVASSSARRSEATSQVPDSASLASSETARVAKDLAMADAPSSTLQAQQVEVANASGAQNPSDIDATSSAAMRNASAAESVASVTADAGSTDFDTGPTQLASEFSTGRAAGGGEPELHLATQTPRASRLAQAGGAELAAVNTEAVAPEPTDVAAEGGGQPEATPTDSQVANVSRSEAASDDAPASSAVAAADLEDEEAADAAGGATELAATRVPRSTAPDATAGAAIGGGTDEPLRESSVAFTANTQADVPTTESELGGAGESQPESIEVATGPIVRQSAREGDTAPAATPSVAASNPSEAEAEGSPTAPASQVASSRAAETGPAESIQGPMRASDVERSPAPSGAQLAAAGAQAVTPELENLAADGGGGPTAPSSESIAANVTRAQAGEAGAQAGAPATPSVEGAEGAPAAASQVAASQVERASTPDAAAGALASGTSAGQPVREAGVSFAASTKADVPSVESLNTSAGETQGIELADASVSRTIGRRGVEGLASKEPTGAEAGDVALNVPNFGPTGRRAGRAPESDESGQPGPAVAMAAGGAPFKVTRASKIPGATAVAVNEIDMAAGGQEADPTEAPMEFGSGDGTLQRRETGGTRALVLAQAGEGGLGPEFAPEAGNPSRKAQVQSTLVALATNARFQQRDVGGPQFSGNLRARDTQSAFQGRKRRPGADGEPGSSPNVGPEIISGLEFLRRHQSQDGSWSFNNFGQGRPGYEDEQATIQSDTAATGLSLMCFLGAGYDHFDFGGEYTREVKASLDWLVKNQQEDGNLYVDQDPESSKSAALYSHAIAAMAVCEAYGMTHDPKLKKAGQKAIEFIEKTQHPDRGGWRYVPGKSADLSVTGWMIAALKSGDLAGLKVQDKAYEAAFGYLDRCKESGSGGAKFVYNPNAPNEQRQGRRPTPAMTAVGLLMRLYEGGDRTDQAVQRGADFLAEHLPDHTTQTRDTYYWYYATQVMFHMHGDYWENWKRRLHEVLRATQERSGDMAGSWDPRGGVPDRWGAHGGRLYVTAMNLLSLEVSYRYLPLYKKPLKTEDDT